MPQVIQYSLFDSDLKIPQYDNDNYTITDRLKFIDLFAGIGGFRIAWESLKAKCVFLSEWDKYARKTYEANFQETPQHPKIFV